MAIEDVVAVLWTPERIDRELDRRHATAQLAGRTGRWSVSIDSLVSWPRVFESARGFTLGEALEKALANYDAHWNRSRLEPPAWCLACIAPGGGGKTRPAPGGICIECNWKYVPLEEIAP